MKATNYSALQPPPSTQECNGCKTTQLSYNKHSPQAHTHTHTHTPAQHPPHPHPPPPHTHACTHTHIYTHTYTHACIHVYIHTHTQTHTDTHTHTHSHNPHNPKHTHEHSLSSSHKHPSKLPWGGRRATHTDTGMRKRRKKAPQKAWSLDQPATRATEQDCVLYTVPPPPSPATITGIQLTPDRYTGNSAQAYNR